MLLRWVDTKLLSVIGTNIADLKINDEWLSNTNIHRDPKNLPQ